MSKSLKKDIEILGREILPRIFESNDHQIFHRIKNTLNHKHGGLIVIPLVFTFYIIGQYFKPSLLQILHIDTTTAFSIIDQRTSNMATIFSITLVVIGWLITNLSVKESISYQLMFKQIYLYPIFYFIATLIASLIIISLFRNTSFFNAGDAVVSASYLILVAICAIVSLFRRLIQVIDDNYFFELLEKEVVKESYSLNYKTMFISYGKKIYSESIDKLGIIKGSTSFFAKTYDHKRVLLIATDKRTSGSDSLDDFFNEENVVVKDVNVEKIHKLLSKEKLVGKNYYQSMGIFEIVSSNFSLFELHKDCNVDKKITKKIQSAFKTKLHKSDDQKEERKYTEYLKSRIIKETKIGKKDNVDAMLKTMQKIYEMEDLIKSKL